jgi:hypothetical protein
MARPIAGLLVALSITLLAGGVGAEPRSSCDGSLIINAESVQSNDSSRLSFLRIIDQERFEQIKREGGAGAKIPVQGVPVAGFANYSSFNAARSREFKEYQFASSEEQARSYTRTFLSPEGASAYVQCLRLQALNNTGVHLWVDDITENAAKVTIRWTSPAELTTPAVLNTSPKFSDLRLHRQ